MRFNSAGLARGRHLFHLESDRKVEGAKRPFDNHGMRSIYGEKRFKSEACGACSTSGAAEQGLLLRSAKAEEKIGPRASAGDGADG
jgi:hypothetical protein